MLRYYLAALLAIVPLSGSGTACAQTPPSTGTTGATAPPPVPLPPLFSETERTAIVAYWNAPGRYILSAPPDAATDGPYRVRLTADGSQWFRTYQITVAGKAKLPPTMDARPTTGPFVEWETWVAARLAYDRAVAQRAADAMNRAFAVVKPTPTPRPLLASRAGKRPAPDQPTAGTNDLPPAPGPIPAGLLTVCGNPPPFASVVTPLQYQVRFDDPEEVFTYIDNVKLRERYAYYRFPRGIASYGTRLKDMTPSERDELFRAAGFTPSEQRIFAAVSKLEGGFETVQTYDTGFVSVGFIQFVTLAEGKHDLSEVLLLFKANRPREYQEDFRRFGIDVQPDRTLTVVDPATGAELTGNAAVLKIIDDKRLTAVFQRAGRRPGFRIAQIKVAKAYYWPTNDPLTATLADGTILAGKVGDCIKSEAGLACLLDRKINTGNIRLLNDVAQRVAVARGCKTIADLAAFEQEIIAAMKYRDNFLADNGLGQPAPPPMPVAATPKTDKPDTTPDTTAETPAAPEPSPTTPAPGTTPPGRKRR
ncbi:MAG: hypothetical protein SFU56_18450 [Capsulimonadales bacterium]|nr:hypothetical protein [Capsulimonadales bacterium]